MTVVEAHDVAHQVEDALKQQFEGVAEVIVHVEPDDACHSTRAGKGHVTV
jgi:divalent metal cation (Fe/Co/Zn/Cd) transporter